LIEYPLVSANELAGEAWAAMKREDADEALRLWQALREYAPERPEGFIWPIQVLWQRGRFDEAEATADEAFAVFPAHPELFVQHAWIASVAQRWEAAAARWAVVRECAPDRIEGYLAGARALWQDGRAEDAETVTAEGLHRFPENVELLAESGWVATVRQDWGAALDRWAQVHQADPNRLDAQVRLVHALRMMGRIGDAEALCAAALDQNPGHVDLLIEHAQTAMARQDWAAAAERLDRASADERNAARVAQSLGPAEARVRALAAEAAEPPAEDHEISPSALMLRFESLGERCDFGAVQRSFGVEPLGLLRFAWSRLDNLIAALEDRFAAVGTVEDTAFERFRDETIVRMQKYELIFHTFVENVHELSAEKQGAFRQQQRRRLVFLKDKLIADLEEPQKIWVYATEEYTAEKDVARLFAALRAYGPNSLLYVRPAWPGHPSGTVEMVEDGLYAGYFPGIADFVGGQSPPFELWRRLCLRTHRLAQGDNADNAFIKSLI
jgi:tetratricopeptide (TPR) repeat protein